MASPGTFRLPVVSGRKFVSGSVLLGNTRYENCEFRNCEVVYRGGPGETSACYFENVRRLFEGQAGNVVLVMKGLGWRIERPN
jgi:hypothetical protein